jgi:hypothetical protein
VISFHDGTKATGDEGLSTRRRSKVFTWNPYLYDAWAEGGATWLSGPTLGDDSDDGPLNLKGRRCYLYKRRNHIIRICGDSKPFPAYLISHKCKNRTIHVNYAINEAENSIVIITAYEPDPALWDETYTNKVKK